jgi:cell shape-determining protein MreC
MKRFGSFQLLILACAAALILSLFVPTRALRWTNGLAAMVRLPAAPLAALATRTRAAFAGGPAGLVEEEHDLEHYRSEMHHYLALYNAERLRAHALQERIEQLERARVEGGDVHFEPVIAPVIGRTAQGNSVIYELRAGASEVQKNAVAVYDGAHLIGRIAQTSALTSLLIPITDPAIGPMQAYVAPERAGDDRRLSDFALTLLTARGDGLLEGEVESQAGAALRDYLLLDDPTWPKTGRAMIVGRIVRIEPIEESPLRARIIVQPTYDLANLSSVTIKVEQAGSAVTLGGDE